jgi:hypothetical protein
VTAPTHPTNSFGHATPLPPPSVTFQTIPPCHKTQAAPPQNLPKMPWPRAHRCRTRQSHHRHRHFACPRQPHRVNRPESSAHQQFLSPPLSFSSLTTFASLLLEFHFDWESLFDSRLTSRTHCPRPQVCVSARPSAGACPSTFPFLPCYAALCFPTMRLPLLPAMPSLAMLQCSFLQCALLSLFAMLLCACTPLLTPGTKPQADLSVVHFCRSFDDFCHSLPLS